MNNRSYTYRPKLKRLRPRTTDADAKDLTIGSCKSSTSSSSYRNKRKDNKTDDENMKQMPKKKKPRCAAKKH